MDIIIINHESRHIYTNSTEALEGVRRKAIEKVYKIDPRYKFIYCLQMPDQISGIDFNLIKIEDVPYAAVVIVEFFVSKNNS